MAKWSPNLFACAFGLVLLSVWMQSGLAQYSDYHYNNYDGGGVNSGFNPSPFPGSAFLRPGQRLAMLKHIINNNVVNTTELKKHLNSLPKMNNSFAVALALAKLINMVEPKIRTLSDRVVLLTYKDKKRKKALRKLKSRFRELKDMVFTSGESRNSRSKASSKKSKRDRFRSSKTKFKKEKFQNPKWNTTLSNSTKTEDGTKKSAFRTLYLGGVPKKPPSVINSTSRDGPFQLVTVETTPDSEEVAEIDKENGKNSRQERVKNSEEKTSRLQKSKGYKTGRYFIPT